MDKARRGVDDNVGERWWNLVIIIAIKD